MEHPPWHLPQPSPTPTLHVHNSLTGKKEPFIPANGRQVLWYTCGPTVYDVCHMGHARAYLTFDILRRIMTDYFHYDVQYHVNITDVDDKIILRARRNKLLADYLASQPDAQSLHSRAAGALAAAEASTHSKHAQIDAELAQAALDPMRRQELTDQREQLALKLIKLQEKRAQFALLRASDAAAVASLMGDELATTLDAELGSTVVDNAVFDAHARKYEASFMHDMDLLGVRPPDVLTRVTEYVPAIVEYVQTLVTKGMAYVSSSGSVYLDIAAFKKAGHDYRKLKPRAGPTSDVELAESEGALGASGEKKDPSDFVLWKASKPGEPSWASPWGKGRPGWHIECSVVAGDVLGRTLDVHAGGEDLKFPHHDNELAQSEAHYGCQQWVNYFFHAGHLNIKGLKMSKSLKNFVTIQEAVERDPPRLLRLLFLVQPWDGSFTYSPEQLDEARRLDERFAAFFAVVRDLENMPWLDAPLGRPSDAQRAFQQALQSCRAQVHAALCDNFDTPRAVQALRQLVDAFNQFYLVEHRKPAVLVCLDAARFVAKMFGVFGLPVPGHVVEGGSAQGVVGPLVDALIGFREQVRGALSQPNVVAALREACDVLRDETLPRCGVKLEDRSAQKLPPLWSLHPPEELARQAEQARERAELERVDKAQRKAEKAQKDAAKWAEALQDGVKLVSKTLFRTADFSAWDDEGLPTHDAAGAEVAKAKLKKLRDELKKAQTSHAKLVEEAAKAGLSLEAFCEARIKEAADLQRALTQPVATIGSFKVGSDLYQTHVDKLKGKAFADVEEYTRFL